VLRGDAKPDRAADVLWLWRELVRKEGRKETWMVDGETRYSELVTGGR